MTTAVEILSACNEYRASRGLAPYAVGNVDMGIAQRWADRMASTGVFEHGGKEQVIERSSDEMSAAQVVRGWVNSKKGHREWMESTATTAGFGIAYGNGWWYYAGSFGGGLDGQVMPDWGMPVASRPVVRRPWWQWLLGLFGGCLLLLSIASAAEPVARGEFEVLRVKIHDADTIRGDVALPFGVALLNQSIRGEGYDAWEVDRTRGTEPFDSFTDQQWQAETTKGIIARNELAKLAEGGRWYVSPSPDGKSVYGRLEGRLIVVTKTGVRVDVADWASAHGHVRDSKTQNKKVGGR